MSALKLAALAGSTRSGSFNRAILAHAADAAESAGAQVDRIDLRDFPMPIFQQDEEAAEGLPESVRALKQRLLEVDGLLIASPEYNSSYSPLLKNAIDWCSRTANEDEAPLSVYRGKTALLIAASPGALGGLRGLTALRTLLQNIGVTVYPDFVAVRSAHEAVDEAGKLSDEKWRGKIAGVVSDYVAFAARHSS